MHKKDRYEVRERRQAVGGMSGKWLYKGYIRAMGNILWLLHSYLFCRVCSLINTYAIYSDSGNGENDPDDSKLHPDRFFSDAEDML